MRTARMRAFAVAKTMVFSAGLMRVSAKRATPHPNPLPRGEGTDNREQGWANSLKGKGAKG